MHKKTEDKEYISPLDPRSHIKGKRFYDLPENNRRGVDRRIADIGRPKVTVFVSAAIIEFATCDEIIRDSVYRSVCDEAFRLGFDVNSALISIRYHDGTQERFYKDSLGHDLKTWMEIFGG